MVYIDPFHIADAAQDADLILITHDHFDHFSPEDIEKIIRPDTLLVVPERMKDKASSYGNVQTVTPGEKYTVCGIGIEAVPAYNRMKPFSPPGKPAGWGIC